MGVGAPFTIDVHELVGAAIAARRGAVIASGVLVGPQVDRCARAYDATIDDQVLEGEWAALLLPAA